MFAVIGTPVLLTTGLALAQTTTPARNAADLPSFEGEGGKKPATAQIIVKLKKGASSEALVRGEPP